MKCSNCGKKAVFSQPDYCKEHFIQYFDTKVLDTIKEHNLVKKGQKICVAASGGKDSITVMHILHKYFGNVGALAVDEGIKDYRSKTLEDLQLFCKERNISLRTVSFKENLGKDLDNIVPNLNTAPCSACGISRRYLLNKFSKDYNVIATGHNLDDESQAMLMNVMKSNINLLGRQNIKTSEREGFTVKIKPLYFMTEKEIRAYALLQEWKVSFTECPYSPQSFRGSVQQELNKNPKLKLPLAQLNLKLTKKSNTATTYCKSCKEPSSKEICKFCELKQNV